LFFGASEIFLFLFVSVLLFFTSASKTFFDVCVCFVYIYWNDPSSSRTPTRENSLGNAFVSRVDSH
jgi:hypothetical protein